MIIANFTDGYSTATAPGLYQWDYGQILEIHGLSLPPAVEVHFAIVQSTDDAKTRIGTTIDKVTKVAIPEFIVEQSGDAVAYIYISDTTSGKTVKKINMPITARQKPEAFDAPEDAQLFREAIESVNAAADRAEDAEKSSEAWAHGHEEYPDRDEDNAAYYANLAHDNATSTSKDKKSVEETADSVNNIAMRVNADKEESEQYRLQAAQSAAAALESENNSKASENASKKAMEEAQIAEGQAELFAEQSGNSADTAEQAKNLVMQIGREVTENKEYVDKKIDDFNVLHQQAVQNIDNAGNNQVESINSAGQKALENIGTGIDPTFTQEGKAAEAKATGDKLRELKDDIDEIIGESEYKDVSVLSKKYVFINPSFSLPNASSDYSVFYFKLTKNKRYVVNVTGIGNFKIGFSDSTPVAGMTLQDGVIVNRTVYEFTNMNYDYAVVTGMIGTEATITYTVKEYDLIKSIAQLDAEIKTIDGSINDINYKYSSENVIPTSSESFELSGVTITPNGTGAYLLNGTVSESKGYFIYRNENSIHDNIVNGNEYSFSGEIPDGVSLSIRFFADNSWLDDIGISKAYSSKKINVPSNATGMSLYLYFSKGNVYDSAELKFYLISTSSAKYVEDIVDEYHKEETPPPLLTIVDDDGYKKFKTLLLPIIQNKHIPISSSVPTSEVSLDYMMTWDDIVECALEGAEILSHTHGNLSRSAVADMTTEEIATDYRKAQALLRNHGIMSETLTFVGDSSNVEKCVEACRRVYRYGLKAGTNKTNYKATINPYGLDRWNIPPNTELQTLKDKIDSSISDGTGWMIWMIHTSDGTFQQSFADVLSEAIDYAISKGLEIGNMEYGTRIYCE